MRVRDAILWGGLLGLGAVGACCVMVAQDIRKAVRRV